MSERELLGVLKDIKNMMVEERLIRTPPPYDDPIGIIGGDIKSALPFLRGWSYKTDGSSELSQLIQGAPRTRLIEWTDEEGYVYGGYFITTNPDVNFRVLVDNVDITTSARVVSTVTSMDFGLMRFSCPIYDPALPRYAVAIAVEGLAYRTRILIESWLPTTALDPIAYITNWAISRAFINDRKEFIRSVYEFAVRQSAGKIGVKVRANE